MVKIISNMLYAFSYSVGKIPYKTAVKFINEINMHGAHFTLCSFVSWVGVKYHIAWVGAESNKIWKNEKLKQ